MGYDRSFGPSAQFRVGRYLTIALGLGVALGLAVPVSAGIRSDLAGSASLGVPAGQAPSEAGAASDGAIVVADKHNNKNGNNKNWNNKNVVVVRPYRHWNKRPYYGTVIGGVALGTILGAAAYSAVAPAPNLCWYWADPSMSQGYWDYC
jgi:hypothetical protein